MTKADQKMMELTAQAVAHETIEALKKELPCEVIRGKVSEIDNIVNDGLKDDVKEIKDDFAKHNKWHEKQDEREEKNEQDKIKGRKAFWRAVFIGIGISAFGTISGFLISKVIGG